VFAETNSDLARMFVCFRWVLVWFKRELSYPQTLRLWECLWANSLTSEMHLFCCVAVLRQLRGIILRDQPAFDEMLAVCSVFIS
jgi:hypothetical protein